MRQFFLADYGWIDKQTDRQTLFTPGIKNEISVINYSPSYHSKPARSSFIFGRQIKIFLMKSKSFFYFFIIILVFFFFVFFFFFILSRKQ